MSQKSAMRQHFIKQLITDDLATNKHQAIVTRFPPEPNGYLHIGHAKAICLNFGLAEVLAGKCYLRFDDTNPMKEEEIYAKAIQKDVEWLGFKWCAMTHASDYYQQLYDFAVILINQGLAYVDSLSMEEIKAYRGTLAEKGRESPYRNRSIAENADLFARMRKGEFKEGEHVLRAKIDMQAGNMNLRDPVIYRIRHATHPRTKDKWCIYPMYDYAHPISDALEHITHSLCTLEFQDHRPLYDWFIEHLPLKAKPRQIEFSRLNVSHTVTSKRKLRELVENNLVEGWDDPRMPTLCGMRKRGYPAEALRLFCDQVGLSKAESVISMSLLEECVREVLNKSAPRALAVLEPLKVEITNYPSDKTEDLIVPWHNKEGAPTRTIPFTHTIYIERSDFMENPSPDFFRLAVGKEVRLRHAYIIKCDEVVYAKNGQISQLKCSYDPDTLGKKPAGRNVKGVIHWVAATFAHPIEFIDYDRLFLEENPQALDNFLTAINKDSKRIYQGFCEPALKDGANIDVLQFERLGYYCIQQINNKIVNSYQRIVSLKDTWGQKQKNA